MAATLSPTILIMTLNLSNLLIITEVKGQIIYRMTGWKILKDETEIDNDPPGARENANSNNENFGMRWSVRYPCAMLDWFGALMQILRLNDWEWYGADFDNVEALQPPFWVKFGCIPQVLQMNGTEFQTDLFATKDGRSKSEEPFW